MSNHHSNTIELQFISYTLSLGYADICIGYRTNSSAATYHLARHLESTGEIQGAVRLYSQSQCLNHAIRLAKVSSA